MSYGTNINSPQGFQPSCYMSGAPWNGQTSDYALVSGYATSLFRGDPVTWDTNGTIKIGVAGSGIIGIFWGVTYTDTTGTVQYQNYWNASTVTQGAIAATVHVIDDPNVLFDIAVSTTSASNPAVVPYIQLSNLGQNANFAVAATTNPFAALPVGTIGPGAGTVPAANPGAGNTTSGNSGYFIDYTTLGNSATLSCKLIRLTPVPGNIFATNSNGPFFQNVIVKLNNDIYNGGTGTAGAH